MSLNFELCTKVVQNSLLYYEIKNFFTHHESYNIFISCRLIYIMNRDNVMFFFTFEVVKTIQSAAYNQSVLLLFLRSCHYC